MKHLIRHAARQLPDPIKLSIRVGWRWLRDQLTGTTRQLVTTAGRRQVLPRRWSIQQPILPGPHTAAKQHNLQLAAQLIRHRLILPGQIFSFSTLIGQPTAARGYQAGRMLINGQVSTSVGGGLCQLSGMLYLAALQAGLAIVERHPHSLDIYTETNRFAPLGADATVVYGHKDLRFQNTGETAICFDIEWKENTISIHFCSAAPWTPHTIEFLQTSISPERVNVQTHRAGNLLFSNEYRRLLP
ncbi:vancomycin resistance protein VanW [Chitinivorax tropicus]|uniref:Vancomycin resistance protein VanW n=1 Tax=Chitinivorax tropicus TaxID=714531 RepID=A0A840MLX0_9PROT|nr:VanW family protein [Chitinivorax tropicus]MBB5017193.1 vancomycin resistance protein VanW [Chitinivorax tropicus]